MKFGEYNPFLNYLSNNSHATTISQARDLIPPAIGKLKEENPFIFKEI